MTIRAWMANSSHRIRDFQIDKPNWRHRNKPVIRIIKLAQRLSLLWLKTSAHSEPTKRNSSQTTYCTSNSKWTRWWATWRLSSRKSASSLRRRTPELKCSTGRLCGRGLLVRITAGLWVSLLIWQVVPSRVKQLDADTTEKPNTIMIIKSAQNRLVNSSCRRHSSRESQQPTTSSAIFLSLALKKTKYSADRVLSMRHSMRLTSNNFQ